MPELPAPIVVYDVDLFLPDGKEFFTSPETITSSGMPVYKTATVANMFFGRSVDWLKKFLRWGFREDTQTQWMPPGRNPSNNYREWRLYDIEILAYVLRENDLITTREAAMALKMIKLQGQIWGLIL